VDVSVAISPIHDGSGAVVGASLIARDISDRKVLEQALDASRRDLADFTENANVPLHWVNAEGIIVWANKAELDFLGYSRPEYVGQSITNFHADAAAITDILARLSAGQCLAGYEARLRAKDGSIKHVSIHSSVYRENGQFRHTRCFTVDISARRQGEHQAREQARLAAFVAAACRALVQRGSREALAGRVADAVAAGLPAAGVRVWLADATGGEWRLAARGGPLGRAPAHLLPPGDRDRVARWITRPLTPGAGMATRWPEGVDLLGAVVHPVGLDGETIGIVEAVSNRPVDVAAYAAFGAVCDALSLALARPPDAPSSARPVP
jgi:PAS domain S-box-containing protein